MRRHIGVVAQAAVGAALLVAGCGVRTGGSPVSPCFRVLPEAHAAVSGQGSFIDVARIRGRRIDALSARQREPGSTGSSTLATTPPRAGPRDVCLIAYKGTFNPDLVQQLIGPRRPAAYAVVVVSVRTQRVSNVFLTDRLPPPLRSH